MVLTSTLMTHARSTSRAQMNGFTSPQRMVYMPQRQNLFERMLSYRHVALVFDAINDVMRVYTDGVFVGDAAFSPGDVGRLDCANGPSTYYGIGHRAPGGDAFVGEVQDTRMYVGQALTEYVAGSQAGSGQPTLPGRPVAPRCVCFSQR